MDESIDITLQNEWWQSLSDSDKKQLCIKYYSNPAPELTRDKIKRMWLDEECNITQIKDGLLKKFYN